MTSVLDTFYVRPLGSLNVYIGGLILLEVVVLVIIIVVLVIVVLVNSTLSTSGVSNGNVGKSGVSNDDDTFLKEYYK